jgi:hypothetical protein
LIGIGSWKMIEIYLARIRLISAGPSDGVVEL